MIRPDTGWGIVLKHVRPLAPVVLSLGDALGYCLAEDVRADRDLPPADRSAMDGYAVRHADLKQRPCVLRVMGEVAAGSPARPRLKSGACVRIFTGANIPPGADTVVMVEQTEPCGDAVRIRSSVAPGANILARGEDARKGAMLLPRGARIDAARVGLCAAVGRASVKVYRRPSVTILCTGSELRAAGDRVRSHETRNSNGPAVCAALAQWGFAGAKFSPVADRQDALLVALRHALKRCDVVLLTGGVSAGKYDFVRHAVEACGARIRFHGLAMKPGKPTLYATAPAGRHVFGLPGNPLSALTAFHEFALPALRRLAGHPAETCRPSWRLPLAGAAESKTGRVRYELARLVSRESGLAAVPVPSQSSADLASAGQADGVVVLPPGRARFPSGEFVVFRPWRPLP
jgi:molybdopterin molybdotransferase